jgi:hypothetical protein
MVRVTTPSWDSEGCIGAGMFSLWAGLAEDVCDDVECSEEGVHVEHEEAVPFPSGSVGKLTLVRGHLPLKYPTDNLHQAFKYSTVSLFVSTLIHSTASWRLW